MRCRLANVKCIVCSFRDAHAVGVCHGDIKSENVMLTSWGWVYLVDFSGPYKPVRLFHSVWVIEDAFCLMHRVWYCQLIPRLITDQVYLDKENPTAFRLFFDTTGRRKCCIAPERFVKGGVRQGVNSLRPEMDIFSAGCVLAELFSDGSSVLKYSDLGRCDAAFLKGVDLRVRTLVSKMVSEDPACRPKVCDCLEELLLCCEGVATAADFDAMEAFCAGWCNMTPTTRVVAALERTRGVMGEAFSSQHTYLKDVGGGIQRENDAGGEEDENIGGNSAFVASSIAIEEVQRVAEDLSQEIVGIMHETKGEKAFSEGGLSTGSGELACIASTLALPRTSSPAQAPLPKISTLSTPMARSATEISTFVANNLTIALAALVRPSRETTSKLALLERLEKLSVPAGQDLVARVTLPLFVVTSTDKQRQQPRIQYFSLTSLAPIMHRSNLDIRMVADYIMPALSLVPNDTDIALRTAYAVVIGRVLIEGVKCEECVHACDGDGGRPGSCRKLGDHCELLKRVRGGVERGVHDILVDPSPLPKLALLDNLEDVARGLGPDLTLEGLLPALLTLYNTRQHDVRASMYRSLEGVTRLLGGAATPFILPFVDRLVSGPDVWSIVSGIRLLVSIIEQGVLAPRDILGIFEQLQGSDVALYPVIQGEVKQLAKSASRLIGRDLAVAMLTLTLPDQQGRKRDAELQSSHSSLPYRLDVSEHAIKKSGNSFQMPANLASYSVDVDGDNKLEHLVNNTNASVLASPTLLKSPSFRKKRVDPIGTSPFSGGSRNTGSSPRGSAVQATRRRAGPPPPTGALVAQIPCHSKTITGISENIGPQSTLFITSSKDGACKLWDTRKLERDITFGARGTFLARASGAEYIKDDGRNIIGYGCCMITPGTSTQLSFVAGRSDGILDAWNIEREASAVDSWKLTRGAEILDVRPAPCGNICIASTAAQSITGIDPRLQGGLAWGVHTEPSLGIPMRLGIQVPANASSDSSLFASSTLQAASPYFVMGTSRGYLTVWDTRFLLPVTTWRNPASAPIMALEIVDGLRLGTLPMNCQSLNGCRGPVAIVSCGEEEISGWDLATGNCTLAMGRLERPGALKSSVMDISKPAEDPVGLARQMGALELRSLSIKRTTIRAMAFVADEQDADCISVVAGGADRKISLWNPRMGYGMNVTSAFASSPACHRDTVTALRHVRGLGAKPLLASASADGVLNVWK